MQKCESKSQLIRDLQSQVEVKKHHALVEKDRDKEAFELNRKLDAAYWDSEKKRVGAERERASELQAELQR